MRRPSAASAARIAAGPDRPQQLQARLRTRANSLRRASLRRCAQRVPGSPRPGRAATIASSPISALAESDFFLKRYAAARDALTPHLDHASRRAEARFFYLSAIRELGKRGSIRVADAGARERFPGQHVVRGSAQQPRHLLHLSNQDELAAQAFKECFERFPGGQHAQRVAWKYGWWAYKTGNYAETVRVFEGAAATFPRSDYRPSYLYWAARAHGRMGERATAESRMRLVYADYMNSYYGRLARKQLATQHAALVDGAAEATAVRASLTIPQQPTAPELPPTAPLIRTPARRGPVRRRAERAAIRAARLGHALR